MSEYTETKELAAKAAKFYESLEGLTCFQKRDVVAILSTFIELEVRRDAQRERKP